MTVLSLVMNDVCSYDGTLEPLVMMSIQGRAALVREDDRVVYVYDGVMPVLVFILHATMVMGGTTQVSTPRYMGQRHPQSTDHVIVM